MKKNNTEETEGKKKIKKFEIIKILIVIMLTAIITYFCTVTMTLKSYLNGNETTYLATKLTMVKNKLKDTYIYDMNQDNMIESAIKGYVSGIGDKYTQYLTKADMQSLLESTTGSYVGIGVYMANNTASNSIMIIGVIEGSSAEKVRIASW